MFNSSIPFGPNGPFRSRIGEKCEEPKCDLFAAVAFREPGKRDLKLLCPAHAKQSTLSRHQTWHLIREGLYSVECSSELGGKVTDWRLKVLPEEERWLRVSGGQTEITIIMKFAAGKHHCLGSEMYEGNQLQHT